MPTRGQGQEIGAGACWARTVDGGGGVAATAAVEYGEGGVGCVKVWILGGKKAALDVSMCSFVARFRR